MYLMSGSLNFVNYSYFLLLQLFTEGRLSHTQTSLASSIFLEANLSFGLSPDHKAITFTFSDFSPFDANKKTEE